MNVQGFHYIGQSNLKLQVPDLYNVNMIRHKTVSFSLVEIRLDLVVIGYG